mgnify:CR=1 FL=1
MRKCDHDGTGIHCDCCPEHPKLMLIIAPQEKLEVKRDHHVVALSPREVLERISGTSGQEGVLNFVRRVL